MLFDRKSEIKKLNGQALVVGYDLGDAFSQISLCRLSGKEPETLSTVAGAEQYNIPTVLCKKTGETQWSYGKDAVKSAGDKEGILVEHLLSRARKGEKILLEQVEYQAAELLGLFMKRSFALLSMSAPPSGFAAIMITVDKLDEPMVEVLNAVTAQLALKAEQVFFQSHEESAYHYIIHQPRELWNRDTLIFDDSGSGLKVFRMEQNRRTVPVVAFMEERNYPRDKKTDDALLEIARELCEGRIISTVYLIGDDFKEDFYSKTLAFLCRSRRVFQGNNLFSKGACYGIRELAAPTELANDYIFLGRDKLKANIGMRMVRQRMEGYMVLLNAGESWYDTGKSMDFILESGNVVSIIITPLNEKEGRVVDIALSGLPVRPDRAARIHLMVRMVSEEVMQVFLQDRGFGELFPATELEWTEEISIV